MFTGKQGSKVFISPHGWVEVIWGKLIDTDEYVAIAQQMIALITLIEDRGEESTMLIDFSALENITPEAGSIAADATKELGCRKIAGFGIKPQFKGALDSIKTRSTKADTIREFANREDAEKWLME